MKNEFTDEEAAGLIWNTLYPNRKPFSQIGEEAQEEWKRFVNIARSVFNLEKLEPEIFEEFRQAIKL